MIQLSIYNLHTKQKYLRYKINEEDTLKVFEKKIELEDATKYKAFDVVLVEVV